MRACCMRWASGQGRRPRRPPGASGRLKFCCCCWRCCCFSRLLLPLPAVHVRMVWSIGLACSFSQEQQEVVEGRPHSSQAQADTHTRRWGSGWGALTAWALSSWCARPAGFPCGRGAGRRCPHIAPLWADREQALGCVLLGGVWAAEVPRHVERASSVCACVTCVEARIARLRMHACACATVCDGVRGRDRPEPGRRHFDCGPSACAPDRRGGGMSLPCGHLTRPHPADWGVDRTGCAGGGVGRASEHPASFSTALVFSHAALCCLVPLRDAR